MTTKPWVILATCCSSLFLVTMDVTIVNVALPSIARDLDASTTGLQWSIDAYTLVIASFLMLAGSTADRLGRKRVFQIGLAIFSLGSGLCSFATSIEMLVGFRVVQAIGGAMMNPVAMSIIVNTFTEPKQRAQAIGLWGSVFGLSLALGPLLGGLLVQHVGWRSIFYINVPIGIAAIAFTAKYIPESRAAKPRRIDPVGQALIVVILAALTSSLIEGPHAGWASPFIVALIATFLISLVAFLAYERRRFEPLVDLRFFRSIPFATATLLAVVAFASFNGALFLSSLYLQTARHLGPAHAGMYLLPIAIALSVCSPLSGRLVGAGHVRSALVVAGCALSIGAWQLTQLALDSSLTTVVIAFTFLGIALGLINAPITNAAVSGMPRAQAGVASAFALSGSIVGTSAADPRFAGATHPFWWIVFAGGIVVVMLGVIATSALAKATAARVAVLVDE